MRTIDNASGSAVLVSSVYLGVPEDNPVTSIRIGGAEIPIPGSGSSTSTPEVIQVSGSAGMTLQPRQTKPLRPMFQWPDAQPGFRPDLGFEDGCKLATRW